MLAWGGLTAEDIVPLLEGWLEGFNWSYLYVLDDGVGSSYANDGDKWTFHVTLSEPGSEVFPKDATGKKRRALGITYEQSEDRVCTHSVTVHLAKDLTDGMTPPNLISAVSGELPEFIFQVENMRKERKQDRGSHGDSRSFGMEGVGQSRLDKPFEENLEELREELKRAIGVRRPGSLRKSGGAFVGSLQAAHAVLLELVQRERIHSIQIEDEQAGPKSLRGANAEGQYIELGVEWNRLGIKTARFKRDGKMLTVFPILTGLEEEWLDMNDTKIVVWESVKKAQTGKAEIQQLTVYASFRSEGGGPVGRINLGRTMPQVSISEDPSLLGTYNANEEGRRSLFKRLDKIAEILTGEDVFTVITPGGERRVAFPPQRIEAQVAYDHDKSELHITLRFRPAGLEELRWEEWSRPREYGDPIAREVHDFIREINPALQEAMLRLRDWEDGTWLYPACCLIASTLAALILHHRFGDRVEIALQRGAAKTQEEHRHYWLRLTLDRKEYYLSFTDGLFGWDEDPARGEEWAQLVRDGERRFLGRFVKKYREQGFDQPVLIPWDEARDHLVPTDEPWSVETAILTLDNDNVAGVFANADPGLTEQILRGIVSFPETGSAHLLLEAVVQDHDIASDQLAQDFARRVREMIQQGQMEGVKAAIQQIAMQGTRPERRRLAKAFLKTDAGLEETVVEQVMAEMDALLEQGSLGEIMERIWNSTAPEKYELTVDVGESAPGTQDALEKLSYRGYAILLSMPGLPSAEKLEEPRTLHVAEEFSGRLGPDLEAAIQEGKIQLESDISKANIVVGGRKMRSQVTREQVFLEVTPQTAGQLTIPLLVYLERKGLLDPGSIVRLQAYKENARQLLLLCAQA